MKKKYPKVYKPKIYEEKKKSHSKNYDNLARK